jgi:hypothetical protein
MNIKDIILDLERVFPVVLYKPGDTLESLAFKAGEQKVISYLKNKALQISSKLS